MTDTTKLRVAEWNYGIFFRMRNGKIIFKTNDGWIDIESASKYWKRLIATVAVKEWNDYLSNIEVWEESDFEQVELWEKWGGLKG